MLHCTISSVFIKSRISYTIRQPFASVAMRRKTGSSHWCPQDFSRNGQWGGL